MKLLDVENIVESIQDAVIIIDEHWNVKYVNQSFINLVGRPVEEYLYKNFWQEFPRANEPKLSSHYKLAFDQKLTQRFEQYFENLDLWTELSVSPLKNSGIMIIVKDISERKQLEFLRAQHEKSLKEMADSMPQIVFSSLPDGTINYFNQKWYDYTGFDRKLVGDTSWEPILHPDDLDMCKHNWYEAVKSGNPFEMEFRFKDNLKPGNYKWFLSRALPIRDENGNITKWFGTSTDITEIKNNKAELKKSEDEYKFLADSVPQIVWTSTNDGKLDYVNQRTIEFFGCSEIEIIGDKWQNNIHEDDIENCIQTWTHSLQTGETYQIEMRIKNYQDEYIWFLVRAVPYYEGNKIVKWFGTSTDINLQKLNDQLKDEFISIASHELKTPLTTVKGYLQLLEKQRIENKVQVFVHKSLQNLQKLESLVKDLLDTSKINANQINFNYSNCDYSQLIKNLIEDLQTVHTDNHFIVNISENVEVYCDAERIEQVLVNFINNAIKYSPEDNKIVIDINTSDNKVITCISDNGIGISKENQEKLFHKFFRVDTSSLKYQGMGLGLYISSEIIKKHEGKLWIDSELGKGTKIYFSLPIHSLLSK